MLVFAVETSCDETSVCIMDNNKKIYSHIIFSQEVHQKFGGVVPELASRAHLEIIQKITKKAFQEANIKPKEVDVYAATCGPGLIGGLLVGSTFTKSLAIGLNKPFMPINHLEAHLLSTSFNNEIVFPHISLLVTGGHTQIYLLKSYNNILLLGETVDDAVGEAFDKVAKLLGLSYPGGKQLEQKAKNGNSEIYDLPQPMVNKNNSNFSFSGIKTAVNLLCKKNELNEKFVENISASFQKCIANILYTKLENTILQLRKKKFNILSFSLVGGVANNDYIKLIISKLQNTQKINMIIPKKEMMSDNAAMIAWACIKKFDRKLIDINFKADPRLKV